MSIGYPQGFDQIRSWAKENGVDVSEGRVRFAQYGILRAIASSRGLSSMLVFKGGNALDFVWEPNRSTRDLDFSADMSIVNTEWDLAKLSDFLSTSLKTALASVTADLGIVYILHSIERNPRGADKTFVTYTLKVGYALPDQTSVLRIIALNKPSPQMIPVEISLNEFIGAAETVDVQASNRLRVCTIEDIVAEKLRSLLQQPIRNRNRRQDLLDVAVILTDYPDLDRARIAEFLVQKSVERGVVVSRSAFHDPEIARRAQHEYDLLASTTRKTFIAFDDAFTALRNFVDSLPIPE